MKLLTKTLTFLIGVSLLGSGLTGQEPDRAGAGSEEHAAEILTTFAWPVPGSVTVTETALKKGREAKTRYRLLISASEDGGMRIRYADFEFLEMEGRDVTTPELQRQLAPALAMASAIPDYVIDRDGVFVRADGMEETIERVCAMMERTRDKEEAARLRAAMNQPQMQQMLAATVSNYWDAWVGAWLDWDVAPDESATYDVELPLAGAVFPAELVAEHLGAAPDHPGCVKLTMKTTAGGEELTKAMAKMLSNIATGAGAPPVPEDAVENVAFVNELTVITDPETLRPRWVRTERNMQVRARNRGQEAAETKDEVERHVYEFEWDAPR